MRFPRGNRRDRGDVAAYCRPHPRGDLGMTRELALVAILTLSACDAPASIVCGDAFDIAALVAIGNGEGNPGKPHCDILMCDDSTRTDMERYVQWIKKRGDEQTSYCLKHAFYGWSSYFSQAWYRNNADWHL